MVFDCSLSDSKFSQVSRTLLSILVDLNNAVVWMISSCPLISQSSSPCSNPLGIVPNALITIGLTVTYMFLFFFSSLARSRYSSLSSLSFNVMLWSAWTAKFTIWQVFLFLLLTLTRSCRPGQYQVICLYLKIPAIMIIILIIIIHF